MTSGNLDILNDPATLIAAVVAVTLVGLSKGGLGGAFALMGVPILALVMSPIKAAALLLPVLLMMDAVSLWSWRGWYDRTTLRHMLPAAAAGIVIGGLTAAATSDAAVRFIVGLVAVGFVVNAMVLKPTAGSTPRHRPWLARVCGLTSGYTSFVAHAGGPPFQIYAVPLRMDPKMFTGTSVIFFAVVNVIKVVPYAALGQFDRQTLLSSALMLPLAVGATLLGAAVVRRMRAAVFYPFMYTMILLVGTKLIWDGVSALI